MEPHRKRIRHARQFQLVDIEYESGLDKYNPVGPVITLYGRCLDGTAVRPRIRGFYPYLFLEMPSGLSGSAPDCEIILADINRRLHGTFSAEETDMWDNTAKTIINKKQYREHKKYVKSVNPVTRCNVYGYNQPTTFLKVTLYNPLDVATVRNSLWEHKWGQRYNKQVYECDFLFVLRFMVDKDIRGAGWIEIIDPDNLESVRVSATVISTIHSDQVRAVEAPGSAPFRILSFDIEVAGRKGIFPEADTDPIIQIANYVTTHAASIDDVFGTPTPTSYCIFQWRSYDKETFESDPPGASVVVCRSERDLLEKWMQYVKQQDPDFLTGVSNGMQ